ncbi:MAG: iron-containing alcohol dehydrogenase [Acidobacteriota bacterium]
MSVANVLPRTATVVATTMERYDPTLDLRSAWTADIGSIRVLFGDGRTRELGDEVRRLGAKRALLVTDVGVRAAGHVQRARQALDDAGVKVHIFDAVEENPTTAHVRAAVGAAFAADGDIDLLIGFGGGSAMDCAKAVNFLLTNGGRMEDYWGHDRATKPMLPSIGVPTTAGTGSEAQSFALISQTETGRKMACGDPKARFRTVILDPSVLPSQPREVAQATAIDAITHAVESFVSRRGNPISQMLAREAWRLLDAHATAYVDIFNDDVDGESTRPAHEAVGMDDTQVADRPTLDRLADHPRAMLLGAHLAGAAIECSMLGAAHACANPLTAHYDMVHGTAVGMMLPHVVRANAEAAGGDYADLARVAGLADPSAAALADRLEAILRATGQPLTLTEAGVGPLDDAALDTLADDAAAQWTAGFNPRTADAALCRALYEQVRGAR